MNQTPDGAIDLIAKEELGNAAGEPMYSKISNLLRSKITQKVFRVGDLLPTEMEICDKFGVSRSTARKALSVLVDEGVVVRKRGKGTFVVKPRLTRGLNDLYNFSTEMHMLGLEPRSEILSFEETKPNFRIASLLNINMDEGIYRISRLRLANDVPMLIETAYIPQKYCPSLTKDGLSDSLYDSINEHTGAQPVEATETYDVTLISDQQAKHLNCGVGSPAFKIERISTDSAGNVFEVSTIIAPGDKNRYQIILRKETISVSRKID